MKSIAGIAAVIALVGTIVRADAIKPWSGASASVWVHVPPAAYEPPYPQQPTSSRTGAVASASGTGSTDIHYWGSAAITPQQQHTVTVQASTDAEATGRAGDLLRVRASYDTPNPSTVSRGDNGGLVQAQAGWSGDRLIVHSANEAASPGVARLNFSIRFDAMMPGIGEFGRILARANDQTMTLNSQYALPTTNQGFDTLTSQLASPFSGLLYYEATFHLDLALNASGVSDPFQLSLQADPRLGLSSNQAIHSATEGDVVLSLNSITTTDGRLLSGPDYDVTFASGMLAPGPQPSPVPEPASWMMAGSLLAGAGLIRLGRLSPPARARRRGRRLA